MATLTNTVTAAQLTDATLLVQQQLAEQYPGASTAPGSGVDGLVVQPGSYLAALHTSRANEAMLLGSIQAIVAGQVTATDADVDALASNYFVTRIPGSRASGLIRVVSQTNTPYTIQIGFAVAFSTLQFTTQVVQRVYALGTPGITQTDTNRLMVARPDGLYEFTINVQASQDGPASRLGRGTTLTLLTPATGMLSSQVSQDFTGGAAAETNAQLLLRVQQGITLQAVSGQAHTSALVVSGFPLARVSCLGVGSPLVTRDRQNILSVSTGGKLDCYVRTGQTVGFQTVRLSGVCVNAGTRQFSLVIPSPTSDGLYRVTAIRPAGYVGLGGVVTTSTVYAPIATTFTPLMPSQSDLAFSANQQATVLFLDSLGIAPYTLNEVRSFDLDLTYMPQVRGVADLLSGNQNRPPGVDILVKGGVPCVTTVQLTVQVPAGTPLPDVGPIQSLVASAINALQFGTSTLSSYVVHTAAQPQIPVGGITAVLISGTVYCPTGVNLVVGPASSITLPESTANVVGASNTFFSCSVQSVAITFVN